MAKLRLRQVEVGLHFELWMSPVWAVLAAVVFTIGFVAKERMYSNMGWAIAVGGVLRAIVVHTDLDLLYSALSFAALGSVLSIFALFHREQQSSLRSASR